MLGVTLQIGMVPLHRIRESLRETKPEMLGGQNKVVEVDETYVGGKEANKHKSASAAGQSQGGKARKPLWPWSSATAGALVSCAVCERQDARPDPACAD